MTAPTLPAEAVDLMRELYGQARGTRMGRRGPDVTEGRAAGLKLNALLAYLRGRGFMVIEMARGLGVSEVTIRNRLDSHAAQERRARRAGLHPWRQDPVVSAEVCGRGLHLGSVQLRSDGRRVCIRCVRLQRHQRAARQSAGAS
jgi:hypothetical protein